MNYRQVALLKQDNCTKMDQKVTGWVTKTVEVVVLGRPEGKGLGRCEMVATGGGTGGTGTGGIKR